jgi:hypothetical protein
MDVDNKTIATTQPERAYQYIITKRQVQYLQINADSDLKKTSLIA